MRNICPDIVSYIISFRIKKCMFCEKNHTNNYSNFCSSLCNLKYNIRNFKINEYQFIIFTLSLINYLLHNLPLEDSFVNKDFLSFLRFFSDTYLYILVLPSIVISNFHHIIKKLHII